MKNPTLKYCILIAILTLSSCKGCPYQLETYIVFHNTLSTEVTIEFRYRTKADGTDSYHYFLETFQPDEIKDIKVDEYTAYATSKGFASPEFACSDRPNQSYYKKPQDYSYATLSNFTLCEWEGYNYDGLYPVEIQYSDSQCEQGYKRAYKGF